jgi:hypothetical protein
MKKLIIIVFIVLLSACQLIVDVKVPYDHPQLTLNAIINPDSAFSAQVTLNRSVLDRNAFLPVTDAEVNVYKDDSPIATLHYIGNGVYRSDTLLKPVAGGKYSIVADKGNTPGVSAKCSIPATTTVTNAQLSDTVINNINQEIKITLTFKDDPSVANYYEFFVASKGEHVDYFTLDRIIEYESLSNLEPYDPSSMGQIDISSDSYLVKDIRFNGKEVTLHFKINPALIAGNMSIVVRSLSEEYYKYHTTKLLQQSTSGDPFAQPVNVFNNIENGFGIFAGYSQSTYQLKNKPRPVINDFSKMFAHAGDTITVYGNHLAGGYSPFPPMILFKAIEGYPINAKVVYWSDQSLSFIVPEGSTSGRVGIQFQSYAYLTDDPFIIDN